MSQDKYSTVFVLIIALVGFPLHSVAPCPSFLSTSCLQQCLKTTTVQDFCLIQTSPSSLLACLCPACKSEKEDLKKGSNVIKTPRLRGTTCWSLIEEKWKTTSQHLCDGSPGVWGGQQQLTAQCSRGASAPRWLRLSLVLTSWPLQKHSAKAWFALEISAPSTWLQLWHHLPYPSLERRIID